MTPNLTLRGGSQAIYNEVSLLGGKKVMLFKTFDRLEFQTFCLSMHENSLKKHFYSYKIGAKYGGKPERKGISCVFPTNPFSTRPKSRARKEKMISKDGMTNNHLERYSKEKNHSQLKRRKKSRAQEICFKGLPCGLDVIFSLFSLPIFRDPRQIWDRRSLRSDWTIAKDWFWHEKCELNDST